MTKWIIQNSNGEYSAGIRLPLYLPSTANARYAHWSQRNKIMRAIRASTKCITNTLHPRPQLDGLKVFIVRIGRELDTDNLWTACKPVRDGIADSLGINDRDKRVLWNVTQNVTQKQVGCMIQMNWYDRPGV